MKDKRLSLTMDSNTYYQAKRLVPPGQISKLFNNFLKEYVKKLKEQELKEAYQRTAKSKEMREEDKVWEGTIEDGMKMSKAVKKIPKRGEIWLVDYNYKPKQGKERELEIASKIKKIRPSLVVSNNFQNEFDIEMIMAPLSSKKLEIIEPYEILIKRNKENSLDEDSKILFNRLRAIEKEDRLGDYIGVLDKGTMKEVNERLKLVLDLED